MAPRTRSVLTPAGGASREERREDFSITTAWQADPTKRRRREATMKAPKTRKDG